MTGKTISIDFEGYYINKSSLPPQSGIYCVYRCTHKPATALKKGKVSIKELLYIGESENMYNRLSQHNKLDDWQKKVKPGEVLCYSFGKITGQDDRERCEAALIYMHKPPCNTECVNNYPRNKVTVKVSGYTEFLETEINID